MTTKTETIEKPDYTTIIHTEARSIAQEVLKLASDNRVSFISNTIEKDEEKQKEQGEKNADFGIAIINLLAERNIPADYASMVFDKITDEFAGLKSFVLGSIATNEDELMSRVYGKKNYKGKFRKEEVTVGDILLKLNEVREQTGGNKDDYFDSVEEKLA